MKVQERKVYKQYTKQLKKVQNEKPLNIYLTKQNGKYTKPNKKEVLLDSKCM